MAYCEAVDLIYGDIPMSSDEVSRRIAAASDEVDSYLAAWYVTPISPPANDPRARQTILTLKRITAQLASGRIITSMATGGEDTDVHAYGLMLLNEAHASLAQLATGTPDLPGAMKHQEDSSTVIPESELRGRVFNGDVQSEVDAFYGATTPGGLMRPAPYFGG